MLFLLYRAKIQRMKQREDELEKQVGDRTMEVRFQNEALEQQKKEILQQSEYLKAANNEIMETVEQLSVASEIIKKKNKDITDSINYASKIQEAMLTDREQLSKIGAESFVFFRPRDIVSGDFYWFSANVTDRNLDIVVAIDCTGHGVPGAFMTVIGNNLLEDIVTRQQIVEPAEILFELDKRIRATLQQKKSNVRVNDGMDLAILVVDKANSTIDYAGAKNPLYYVHDNKLEIIKGSKYAIGGHLLRRKNAANKEKRFNSHRIKYSKGDLFYIFTDGYIDQFGGKDGRKFLAKNYRALLMQIYTEPLEKQKSILDKTIDDWMLFEDKFTSQEYEQLDDMLIIGLKM